MKRILAFLIVIVSVFSSVGVNAYALEWYGNPLDTTSYQSIIEDAKKRHTGYREPRGILYDIDNNGVPELILLYTTKMKSNEITEAFDCCVTSIYTMNGNTVVPLITEKVLYAQAGGPEGFSGIVAKNERKYFAIFSESGETGDGDDPISRGADWYLYSVSGKSINLEQHLYTEFQLNPDMDVISRKTALNDKIISWNEYNNWISSIQKISVLEEYSDVVPPETLLDSVLSAVKGKNYNEPSSWAEKEVNAAINLGIVPSNLKNNYQQAITREEFCVLATQTLCAKFGTNTEGILKKYNKVAYSRFSDTQNNSVIAMNALEIVNGADNYHFNPDSEITREEAAVIIRKMCGLFENTMPNKLNNKFSDATAISSWAKESVKIVTSCLYDGKYIMNATTNNQFSPKMNYSREQAIVTMGRLFHYVKDKMAVKVLLNYVLNSDYVSTAISENELLGEWKLDAQRTMDVTGESLRGLFGSGIKYGDSMEFRRNSSFEYYIGIGCGGKGKFRIDGDKIEVSYVTYEEETQMSETLHILRDKSGQLVIAMDYADEDKIIWVHS